MTDKEKSGVSRRGFASMDKDKRREIASKGGKAAHAKGTAHEYTPEKAREAGKKGGERIAQDREHMARIGRQGGLARALKASLSNKAIDKLIEEEGVEAVDELLDAEEEVRTLGDLDRAGVTLSDLHAADPTLAEDLAAITSPGHAAKSEGA